MVYQILFCSWCFLGYLYRNNTALFVSHHDNVPVQWKQETGCGFALVTWQQRDCKSIPLCARAVIAYYGAVCKHYYHYNTLCDAIVYRHYRWMMSGRVRSHLLVFLSRFFLSTSVQLKCQPVRTARYLLFPTHKLDSSLRSVSIRKALFQPQSRSFSVSPKTFMFTFHNHNFYISEKQQQVDSLISSSVYNPPVLIWHVKAFIFLWINPKICFKTSHPWNGEYTASHTGVILTIFPVQSLPVDTWIICILHCSLDVSSYFTWSASIYWPVRLLLWDLVILYSSTNKLMIERRIWSCHSKL